MKKKYDIYGIGAALVDTEITLTDKDLKEMNVDKGVMTLVDEQRQTELIQLLQHHLVASKKASGGSGANTIIAASYFGCNNFYSCKVADDENGAFYLKDMQAAGVTCTRYQGSEQGITGKCLVMITPDAERTMNTFLGVSSLLSHKELDFSAAADTNYVYIEGYLVTSETGRAAAIQLRNQAKQHGAKIAMSLSDPAMVQFFRDGLLEMIGDGVDLLFCNQDEALGFTQTDNLDAACEVLRKYAKQFAITCGAQGALVFDGTSVMNIEPCSVKAIDTNGAGDMFAGAFMYCLCKGNDFFTAGNFASLAAANVVSQYGPRLREEQHHELKNSFDHKLS